MGVVLSKRFSRGAGAVVTIALVAVSVLLGPASSAVADPGEDFYLPPNPVAGARGGDVVRSEPFAADARARLATLLPIAEARKVMYTSADAHRAPIAVTGTVLVPAVAWPGPGPRPLVSFAVGAHGAGANCAPSKLLSSGVLTDGSSAPMAEYALLDLAALLGRGITVVITDYQGLGVPGGHPYLQPRPAAYDVLDAARAAIRLGLADPGAPVGIWGYSQGGSAAAAAAEQARDYAPELDLRGTVAGAPTGDPVAALRFNEGKILVGVNGYFVNGLIASYPELAPRITALLNQEGLEFVRRTAQQCVIGSAVQEGFRTTSGYTVGGTTIADALRSDPRIRSVLDDLVIGGTPPAAPVLLLSSPNDDVVPNGGVRALGARWRAGGADVTEADIDTPVLPPALGASATGHNLAAVLAGAPSVDWLTARLTHR